MYVYPSFALLVKIEKFTMYNSTCTYTCTCTCIYVHVYVRITE